MTNHEPPVEGPPRSTLGPSPGKGPWIAVGLLVLAIAAGTWYWVAGRSAPPAPPPAPEATPAPEPSPAPAPAPAAPAGPATLQDVSSDPLYRRGAGEGDVHRRWAIVTDNLAEGVSPRKQLEFLAPSKPFSVQRRGEVTVIAPESYRRYDAFADAVGSIDVGKLLSVYRTIHVELEHAYRALGYPDASLDAVSVRALRRILAAPIPKGDVEVQDVNKAYVFSDPRLEERDAVQKHLLRMGPRNMRIIQGKAREILQQLGPVRVEPAKQQ